MARTVSQALAWARGILSSKGIDSAAIDADLLLAHCLSVRRVDLIIQRDRLLGEEEREAFSTLVGRRAQREPVAYLTGEREFYGRRFMVNRHVFIPRPETEILVEQALIRAPRGSVVFEIGVGSGAVICSILAERSDLSGIGNDISVHALRTALANAALLGVSGRLMIYAGHALAGLRGLMPVIVANPPYIPESDVQTLEDDVRCYEPYQALFGGKDGLDIVQEIITAAAAHLVPRGVLLMEAGIGQREAIDVLVNRQGGLVLRGWKSDLAGIDRVVIVERIHG